MAYVDETYYLEVYKGESVNGFPYLADRASEIIEEQTMYRLRKETFEKMPEASQAAIKKAVCAQIEHLDQLGGTEAESGMLASGSLGKFSFSGTQEAEQEICSPKALRLLYPTGLLYRGNGR